jgi:ADP-dependent phosphofructokinase/glucokinase
MLHAGVDVPLLGKATEPRMAAAKMQLGQEMVHFVFQFQKGLEVGSGRGKIIAHEDNRFIASYDPVNTALQSSMDFDSYCLEMIRHYDGALLSGFHLVALKKCRSIFPEKIDQIRSWKERNQDLFVHIETGSFQSPAIFSYLLDLIPKIPADSLGMNEDELAMAWGSLSGSSSQKQPASWHESIQAALSLQERLGISRVAVHTRDYILSVMKEGVISAREEIFALEKGVEAAASLAAGGFPMAEPPKELNEMGRQAVDGFCSMGAAAIGRGASLLSGGRVLSLTPSLQVKRPIITVGLGDTATASIFFYEIEAIKRSRERV